MVLSVVLPAYNEQSTIEGVVLEHHRVLCSLENRLSDWEIVCLDDASTDSTPAILKKLAASVPKLRVGTYLYRSAVFTWAMLCASVFDATRHKLHSHAERGNETKKFFFFMCASARSVVDNSEISTADMTNCLVPVDSILNLRRRN